MEYEFLKKYVEENKTIREISLLENKSFTTIRYWLKKHKLKTNGVCYKNQTKKEYNGFRYCPMCGEDKKLDDFYSRRGQKGMSTYCKVCTNKHTLDRQKSIKKKALIYKGGCCEVCGYSKCESALEFHHLNPNEKDFNISSIRQLSNFTEKIKNELDKCILVCSNCHREIHSNIIKI
jgi:hypothetical protein